MRSIFRSKFRITQEFGVNANYYKQFGLLGHEGIDLVPAGTVWDVLSLTDGIVVKDEDNSKSGAYGIYLTVWCPTKNIALQYCHLTSNTVSFGDKVTQGQKIGVMGATGNTTGAHVHLNLFKVDNNGIRLNKNNGYLGGVDPKPFLMEEEAPLETSALDECRKQVEQEITAKNETWNELQEVKDEFEAEKKKAEFYEGIIKQYASMLEVAVDTAEIAKAIQNLMGKEDTILKLQKKATDLETSLNNTNSLYRELEERAKTLASEKQAQNEALQEASEANEALTKQVLELKEEILKISQTHESLFQIGKLSICKINNADVLQGSSNPESER